MHRGAETKGAHVEHRLNDEKVAEAEIGSEDWNAKVASTAKEPKGHIDLQDHGNKVEFKNIKVLASKQAAGNGQKANGRRRRPGPTAGAFSIQARRTAERSIEPRSAGSAASHVSKSPSAGALISSR